MDSSPMFAYALKLAEFELVTIHGFVDLTDKAFHSEIKQLEHIASRASAGDPDDWLADEFAELREFTTLSSELAVVALWRCIELYRKSAMRFAINSGAAKNAYRHKEFTKNLLSLGIVEKDLQCARSVDELRCLNNAIKHARRVDDELSRFWRWRSKKGERLGDLATHYKRMCPLARSYLKDLADHLIRWQKVKCTLLPATTSVSS